MFTLWIILAWVFNASQNNENHDDGQREKATTIMYVELDNYILCLSVVPGGGGGVVVSIMNKIDLQQGGNYDGILFASGLLQTVIYR